MQPIVLKDGAQLNGYIRVSTDKQENSPETQAKILRDWAAKLGHPIDLVYDKHISAAKMDFEKRPGGRELLRRLRPGDVMVAVRLDRLFRRGGEIRLLDRLAEQDIRVLTIEDCLPDPDHYMGKFARNLLVIMSDREAGLIASRTREVLAWRNSMGLPVNGRGKYGHTIQHGKNGAVFEFNEEEMQLIREASERRLSGEPCREIAADFTRRGYVSPLINAKTGQPRPWNRQRVLRVTLQYWLQNDIEPPKHAVCDRPTPEEQQQRHLERLSRAQNKTCYVIKGQRYKRVRCTDDKCQDCGASESMYHTPRCSQEQCPLCSNKMADCDCQPRLPRTTTGRKKPKKRFTWRDAGWTASSEPESAGSAAPTAPPVPDSPPSGPPADTDG